MRNVITELEVLVREHLDRSSKEEDGAGIVEYLLLVLFIGLAMIVFLEIFTDGLGAVFDRVTESVTAQ